jgi:hypothetical protein
LPQQEKLEPLKIARLFRRRLLVVVEVLEQVCFAVAGRFRRLSLADVLCLVLADDFRRQSRRLVQMVSLVC